ncbi:acyl-CoA N-acyltransferase, partial [Obba rivulosa]
DSVQIRKITAEQTVPLRHSVLWPNHPVSHVLLPDDAAGLHLGAFLPSEDAPVAVVSVFKEPIPQSGKVDTLLQAARFRKLACDPAHRRRGIGSKLLEHVFSLAQSELGCDVVWCDARVSTQGWYERKGMCPFGEIFYKDGLPYIRMRSP